MKDKCSKSKTAEASEMDNAKSNSAYKKFIRNDIATFARDIDILRSLVRYQNCNRLVNESVAEHSFYVAAFVMKLREYFEFNLERALKMALVHDCPESKISDVPHTIKMANPKLAQALEEAEDKTLNEMFYPEGVALVADFNKTASPEGKVCALADVLSVVLYSNDEIKCGNRVFNYIAIKAIARCKALVDALDSCRNPAYTKEQLNSKINQIVNIYG